jgi:hypothetical protein
MNLGIYGDSYGEATIDKLDAWPNILATKLKRDYNDVKIKNYAKGGSSLYFSYKKFLKTKDLYDIIIFVVTEPNRYPTMGIPLDKSNQLSYFTSHDHVVWAEDHFKNKITEQESIFLQNLKGWFKANNLEFNKDIHELILNDIESKHGNVILYPAFQSSFSEIRCKTQGLNQLVNNMHSLYLRQGELLNIDCNTFTAREKSTLSCHLTPEFNEFIANVFFNKIKTGKWNFDGFFDIKIEMPKTYFYENWD